jgi:hypothetical protein
MPFIIQLLSIQTGLAFAKLNDPNVFDSSLASDILLMSHTKPVYGTIQAVPTLVAYESDKHGVLLRLSFALFLVSVCIGIVMWLSSLTCRCNRGKPARPALTLQRRFIAPRQFTKCYAEIDTDVETCASTPHSLSPS